MCIIRWISVQGCRHGRSPRRVRVDWQAIEPDRMWISLRSILLRCVIENECASISRRVRSRASSGLILTLVSRQRQDDRPTKQWQVVQVRRYHRLDFNHQAFGHGVGESDRLHEGWRFINSSQHCRCRLPWHACQPASSAALASLAWPYRAKLPGRSPTCHAGSLRWSRSAGQFGGFAKLGSVSLQAANFVVSIPPTSVAAYASSGVSPPSAE